MFNNCDSRTNGELLFYNTIKGQIDVIFDVGCRKDTEFLDFTGDVHYFDPVHQFIDELSNQHLQNRKSYFNKFGLGENNAQIYYYPKYQSFYNRTKSCSVSDEKNKIILDIKKGKDYVLENNIDKIDFLKIDTEGYELNVLRGFEDFLPKVQIIQFEYGGTFLDNGLKLIDVVEYLKSYGFDNFAYLTSNGTESITDFTDHYNYCNIICIHRNSDIQPLKR